MMKSETVVWSLVAVALCGVVVLAALVGVSRKADVEPAPHPSPEAEPVEDAGVSAPRTSELLPASPGSIGDYACEERSGRALRTSALRGKFTVANFIFTSCSGTCLPMSTQMARLQKASGGAEDLRLVSFTVDPEIDTPERLAKYAREFEADADRWWFLRCTKEDVVRIAYDEARLVKSPDEIVLHSDKFVLLDDDGAIRAYYSPLQDERWIEKLLADVETLRREPGR